MEEPGWAVLPADIWFVLLVNIGVVSLPSFLYYISIKPFFNVMLKSLGSSLDLSFVIYV